VTYAGSDVAVGVSPNDVADDGAAGEGDDVRSDVEDVTGGNGNDILAGNGAVNALTGGPGDDLLLLRDGGPDHGTCGSGRDSVVADPVDDLDPQAGECEAIDRGRVTGLGRRVGLAAGSGRVKGTRATLRLSCSLDAAGGCAGTVVLGSQSLGRVGIVSFTAQPGTTKVVRVRLSARARRSLGRRSKVRVTAALTAGDARAAFAPRRVALTLRR